LGITARKGEKRRSIFGEKGDPKTGIQFKVLETCSRHWEPVIGTSTQPQQAKGMPTIRGGRETLKRRSRVLLTREDKCFRGEPFTVSIRLSAVHQVYLPEKLLTSKTHLKKAGKGRDGHVPLGVRAFVIEEDRS